MKTNRLPELPAFIEYLQQKNISPAIIHRYTIIVDRLAAFGSVGLENRTKKDILNYLQHLEQQGLQNRTRQLILGVLRHYYTHLQQSGKVPNNPTTLINIRGTKKKLLYKLLTYDELQDFADLYYHESKNTRNYLILSFCLLQGLSETEWRALTVGDIDLRRGSLSVAAQRRTNARTLELAPQQIATLYAYIQGRENHQKLFLTTPVVDKWVKQLRTCYAPFTGFKQTHASIITHWIKTYGLRRAQYMAGHRYISSTESYLTNDLKNLTESLQQFHPLH
jgi:site-specific recombinase XerD